jgi:DcmR-like sensory protein
LKNVNAQRSSWKELLANPGPIGHIVQLYQDADFYGEAVSHFAAEGLVRGESVIIVATEANWANISRRLLSKGFDPAEVLRLGRLTLIDADETLCRILVGDMPDAKTFKSFAKATIEHARAGGKFHRVRWWGEMVNLLYLAGNQRGSTLLDELFDDVVYEQSIAVFHSFLMDKYDPRIYDGVFGDVCRNHAHVIPADDYAIHRTIVDRAVGEVIGPIEGPLLRSLASWAHGGAPAMPASQSILLWVKDAVPTKFDEVLACARRYESETLSAQTS